MREIINWLDARGAVYVETMGWLIGVIPAYYKNNQPFYIAFALYIGVANYAQADLMVKQWQAGGAVSAVISNTKDLERVFQEQCLALILGLQIMAARPVQPLEIRGF